MAERSKGFVQFGNRLLEAIIGAGFTGTQKDIILALARLTKGWQRETVTLTAVALAKLTGSSPTGGFRRALRELVQNNVVLELHDGADTSYALRQDYGNWGRFSASETKLAAIWDRRPKSDDGLLKHLTVSGQLTLQGQMFGGIEEEETDPTGSAPAEKSDPAGSITLTPQGQGALPHRVTGTPDNLLQDGDVDERKDIERQEIQKTTTTTAPARELDAVDAEATRQYAIQLSVTTNEAIGQRWFKGGENPHPVTYGTGLTLAGELRKANVPLEIAQLAIEAVCQASKKDKPMSTISYFREPILEASRVAEQKEFNKQGNGRRGGPLTPIAAAVDPGAAQRVRDQSEQDERDYRTARQAAAVEWSNRPENIAAATLISNRVKAELASYSDSSWGKTAIGEALVVECAKAAKFPDRDTWIRNRHTEPVGAGA